MAGLCLTGYRGRCGLPVSKLPRDEQTLFQTLSSPTSSASFRLAQWFGQSGLGIRLA